MKPERASVLNEAVIGHYYTVMREDGGIWFPRRLRRSKRRFENSFSASIEGPT